jgi:hypothetical protein
VSVNPLVAPNNLVNPSLTGSVSGRSRAITDSRSSESNSDTVSDSVRLDSYCFCKDSERLTVSVNDPINPKTLSSD